jgi:peptidoglycan/xylan/chitin deacetylase (PgdA/CDA1 family)
MRLAARPNELGVVPVLMYHAFTTDPGLTGPWVKTVDEFAADLQWLDDHQFSVISVREQIENRINVPAGKHPVILTFDDASAGQFLFDQDANGAYLPRPASAVGVMEAFFAAHPDFGHTALFAVGPNFCFSDSGTDQLNSYDTCDAKITWLAAHGYEIANHTLTRANLGDVTPDQFAEEVGGTVQWIDEQVSGSGNLSRVLILPYGGRPDPDHSPDVFSMMKDGFSYKGERITLEGIVDVGGGPAFSPSSTWWDPGHIIRFNVDPDSLGYWFTAFTKGEVTLYTSDGDPDTVTVPDPLPSTLQNEFDPDANTARGKQLIR